MLDLTVDVLLQERESWYTPRVYIAVCRGPGGGGEEDVGAAGQQLLSDSVVV